MVKINELLSVAICINRFTWFEEFIIDYTLLIPPNLEHLFLSETIRPCIRCWWLAWIDPWFFALRILEEYPLFIPSHNLMQKRLSFVLCKQHFTDGFSVFLMSLIQFIWILRILLLLWIQTLYHNPHAFLEVLLILKSIYWVLSPSLFLHLLWLPL